MSGAFGCVRSGGWQMHEGLDIGCIERDKKGEPKDSVTATADGTVAYMNKKSALSNYGNYLLLRHQIDGLEIYSTYAHLKEIRSDLKIGSTVKAGEAIAVMGRTTNTRLRLSQHGREPSVPSPASAKPSASAGRHSSKSKSLLIGAA